MGKRGPKPRRLVSEAWSPELAYAIGLIATDGCLSPPGHLINLTSTDKEQLKNFSHCLKLPLKIGMKYSGSVTKKKYGYLQFKNVLFYQFLESIGLMPAKSKTLGVLKVPKKYFWDFLRGCYDGDGSSHSYWDPRWRSSFMFYTIFSSASPAFIQWLRAEICQRIDVLGHVTHTRRHTTQQLKYAKADSLKLLRKMYYAKKVVCLSRKRLKVEKFLRIVGERL